MPALRKSYKLVQYVGTELYQVPTGKSASLSVSFVNPEGCYLYVQKTIPANSFSVANTASFSPVIGDMYSATSPNNASLYLDSSSALPYRIAANTYTYNGSLLVTDHIWATYKYAAGNLARPTEDAFTTLAPSTYRIKSIPVLDYAAEFTKNNGAFLTDGSTNWRFIKAANLATAYTTNSVGAVYTNSVGVSYREAGGAFYDQTAISVGQTGNTSWFYNSIIAANTAISANYTSEPSVGGPFDIVSTIGGGVITTGSPQVFFVGTSPYFWCSAHSSTNAAAPKMALMDWANVQTGAYSSWAGNASVSFPSIPSGAMLHWCRNAGGYYVIGASDGSLYYSGSFNAAYTRYTSAPSDADTIMPPIRIDANRLAFRSKTGGKYHVVNMATGLSWSVVDLLSATTYGYTTNPLLTSTLSGYTVIGSESIGSRSVDLRLYTATQKFTISPGFDTRDNNADLIQDLNVNAERTNLVLEAGDRLIAYSTSANTIVHTYGFEE